MNFKKKILLQKESLEKISPTQFIALGFLVAIVCGTILLMLPIATNSGEATDFIDALFMSTTSVCVTGLTTVGVLEHWNFFGQTVILILIQLGGLGVVTFTTTMFLILGKKLGLKKRILLQESYNLNTLSGLVLLTKRIVLGSLVMEAIGAILYAIQFVPEYGFWQGMWKSIFNSVSAFCNAGMDILGDNSLGNYVSSPLINFVTMALIVLGGLGFIVWWDTLHVIQLAYKKEIKWSSIFSKLRLHSKIVYCMTAGLILLGTIFVFILEYNNPDTIGNLSLGNKLMASLFQSVTTRTAGFLTISQEELRMSTSFICILLMFIGGSPVGTAGGVKTVTIGMLILTVLSVVKGEKDTKVFHRTIPQNTIRRGLAVILISMICWISMIVLLSIIEKIDFMKLLYEVTSAIATVGLSKNVTPNLSWLGKMIIIITMYIGRIGPITMAVAFRVKGKKVLTQLPEEDIIVG